VEPAQQLQSRGPRRDPVERDRALAAVRVARALDHAVGELGFRVAKRPQRLPGDVGVLDRDRACAQQPLDDAGDLDAPATVAGF
jgi:hypothetical protein